MLMFCTLISTIGCTSDTKTETMQTTNQVADLAQLSAINAQFIQNFLKQDTIAHSRIIHPDFVCIESNGNIVDRTTYLKNWATDFQNSGYETFTYSDEHIRIFGNVAFVRSKTTYNKTVNGIKQEGYTIYTESYLKENGVWRCVQVQITPVK